MDKIRVKKEGKVVMEIAGTPADPLNVQIVETEEEKKKRKKREAAKLQKEE